MNGFDHKALSYAAKVDALKSMLPVTRSARFLNRMSQTRMSEKKLEKTCDWSTMLAMPRWALSGKSEQNRIAAICALLHFRQQIDAELSGNRLSALAGLVGEDVFDAACETAIDHAWPLADATAPMPTPTALHSIGWQILNGSLPDHCQLPDITALPTTDHNPENMCFLCGAIANVATDIAAKCAPEPQDDTMDNAESTSA